MSEKDRNTEPDLERIRKRANEVERTEGTTGERQARRAEERVDEIRDRDRGRSDARRAFQESNPARAAWRSEPQGPRDAGHYQFGTGYLGYPGSAMYPFYLGPQAMPGYASGYPDPRHDDPEHRHSEHRFGTWSGAGRSAGRGSTWTPRTEMFDRDGKLIVRVELPGMDRGDVDVSLERDRLVIEGERREEAERHQGEGFYQSEWSYGFFHREIPLPEPVDHDHVKAKFKDGILEVAIPQTDRASTRKAIQIET